jgi:hypothetical protein
MFRYVSFTGLLILESLGANILYRSLVLRLFWRACKKGPYGDASRVVAELFIAPPVLKS